MAAACMTYACTTDPKSVQLLRDLSEGKVILRIKFLCHHDKGDWAIKNKFDPVRVERKKVQGDLNCTAQRVVELSKMH